MANSILRMRHGPIWPLGFIKVVTPGVPVNIMSVVDPLGLNNPNQPTILGGATPEYGFRCQQILFTGFLPQAGPPAYVQNVGNVYILMAGDGTGSATRADTGVLVAILQPGQLFDLASAPMVTNKFGPYSFLLDADNANDGACVSLIIQGD